MGVPILGVCKCFGESHSSAYNAGYIKMAFPQNHENIIFFFEAEVF